jgi:hypothetical protein
MCRPLPPPLMRTRVLLECPRRRQRAFGPKGTRFELPVAAARPSKTARETRGPTLIVIGRRLLQFGVLDDVVLSTAPAARADSAERGIFIASQFHTRFWSRNQYDAQGIPAPAVLTRRFVPSPVRRQERWIPGNHSVNYALALGAPAATRGNSFSALPPRMARLSWPFSTWLFSTSVRQETARLRLRYG